MHKMSSYSYCLIHRYGSRRRRPNMGIVRNRYCEVTNTIARMLWDFAEDQYVIMFRGEYFSDTAALTMEQYPAVVELGEIAYELNRGR